MTTILAQVHISPESHGISPEAIQLALLELPDNISMDNANYKAQCRYPYSAQKNYGQFTGKATDLEYDYKLGAHKGVVEIGYTLAGESKKIQGIIVCGSEIFDQLFKSFNNLSIIGGLIKQERCNNLNIEDAKNIVLDTVFSIEKKEDLANFNNRITENKNFIQGNVATRLEIINLLKAINSKNFDLNKSSSAFLISLLSLIGNLDQKDPSKLKSYNFLEALCKHNINDNIVDSIINAIGIDEFNSKPIYKFIANNAKLIQNLLYEIINSVLIKYNKADNLPVGLLPLQIFNAITSNDSKPLINNDQSFQDISMHIQSGEKALTTLFIADMLETANPEQADSARKMKLNALQDSFYLLCTMLFEGSRLTEEYSRSSKLASLESVDILPKNLILIEQNQDPVIS